MKLFWPLVSFPFRWRSFSSLWVTCFHPHLRSAIGFLFLAFCFHQNVCFVNRGLDIYQYSTMIVAALAYTLSTVLFLRRFKRLAALPLLVTLVTSYFGYHAVKSSRTDLTDQFRIIQFTAVVVITHFTALLIYALSVLCSVQPQAFRAICVVVLLLLIWTITEYHALVVPSSRRGILPTSLLSLPSEFSSCPLPVDKVDFLSVLKPGMFNWFFGSFTCPRVEPFSSLKKFMLYVNCSNPKRFITAGSDYFSKVPSHHLHQARLHLHFASNTAPLLRIPLNNSISVVNTRALFPVNLQSFFTVTCGEMVNFHVQFIPNSFAREKVTELNFDADYSRDHSSGTRERALSPRSERSQQSEWELDPIQSARREKQKDKRVPNVMVLMIDSLSRLHFLRRMTQTVKVLNDLHYSRQTRLFEFFRYHHPSYLATNRTDPRQDRFWWTPFRRMHRHATLYLNNICEDTLELYMAGKGLHLDHHFVEWCCQPEYDAFGDYTNFVGPYALRRRCLAGRYVHQYMLDYIQQAWQEYSAQGIGRALFADFTENHEGSTEVVRTLDQDLADFLLWMNESGHLNNTVLVITADHGIHMGPYYLTDMGQLEHKLPLLLLALPPSILHEYPELSDTLKHNEQAVVTVWDIYATLRHFATYPSPASRFESEVDPPSWNLENKDNHKVREEGVDSISRRALAYPCGPPWAVSLLTKVPHNRTCQDAHIPLCRCPCEGTWRNSDGCPQDDPSYFG